MTVTLTFKTPDVVDQAVEDLPEDEQEEARRVLSRWVKWSEYIRVKVDLESGAATVLPAGR